MRILDRRKPTGDEGFTLIELMVVVLIIAILIAIAIPTFLGAQNRARDRGAQSDLRNALTAAKTVATDHSGLFLDDTDTPLDETDLPDAEPAIDFDTMANAAADTSKVGLISGAGGISITLMKVSASGTAFCISATSDGIVTYDRNDDPDLVNEATECQDDGW
jgi:type IV pilus assembly protein PilA